MNMNDLMVNEVNGLHSNGFHATTNASVNKDALTSFLIYTPVISFKCLIRDSFSVFVMYQNRFLIFLLP